jgi:glutamine synthetase
MLSFAELKKQAAGDAIDTVLVCMVDMQGRLMGKRFTCPTSSRVGHEETHCCNYLLATDIEMATPDGYASTSWEKGYGDYVMKPDLSTLRPVPWLEGTAMVLCDLIDHHTHEPVPHAPRQILKAQVERAKAMGFTPMMATELEFFLFEKSFDDYRKSGFRDLAPLAGYNADYAIQLTTKEEYVMRPIRNLLVEAGVPVENSKGEAEAGQEELNIRYADALLAADHHTLAKQAVKEIAMQHGHSATFLPKWHHDKVGSAAHIHQSLMGKKGPAFHDAKDKLTMSATMKSYVAGLIEVLARHHVLPRALCEQLQAVPAGHLRANPRGLVGRQPYSRFPPVRRGDKGCARRMPHRRFGHEPLSCPGGAAGGGNQGYRGQARTCAADRR